MAIYYVQKKYRVDKDGAKHLNYNVTLPFEAILGMDVDGADRSERAVEVTYDDATQYTHMLHTETHASTHTCYTHRYTHMLHTERHTPVHIHVTHTETHTSTHTLHT